MNFSNAALETTPCPLCRDTRVTSQHFDFPPFQAVQCAACDLWYLSPRLREADMLEIYADDTYYTGDADHGYTQGGAYSAQAEGLRRTFARFMTRLHSQNMTGGSLLEVGCGYGYLLESAAPYFDSLTGLEFNAEAVKHIEQSGFTGIHGGIDALSVAAQYDCIVATCVIEHVYQPVDFVQTLRKHTRGWLILATPQMNSAWFKLLGKRWPSFKTPEHVTYFDANTLGQLLTGAGATNIVPLTFPHAYPLGLIAAKLGINRLPAALSQRNLWLPATMFALAARFDTAHD